MIRLWFRRVDVLVVGSAHIDTSGVVETFGDFVRGKDHSGTIVYSVGGGGYNVAVNLSVAGDHREIALYTFLPLKSRLADLVYAKLERFGVSLNFIQRRGMDVDGSTDFSHAVMGGSVEIRDAQDRIMSVSRTALQVPDFWSRGRDRIAVGRAKAVVVDTHLYAAAARRILQECKQKKTPIFVFAATDSTARAHAANIKQEGVFCIVGTAEVLAAMLIQLDRHGASNPAQDLLLKGSRRAHVPQTASDICNALGAGFVASIDGTRIVMMGLRGEIFQTDLADTSEIKNHKGAADALMAAIVDTYLSNGGKDAGAVRGQDVLNLRDGGLQKALQNKIAIHVGRALHATGATKGSVISFDEALESWSLFWRQTFQRLSARVLDTVSWIALWVLFSWTMAFFRVDHYWRVPLKKLAQYLGTWGQHLLGILLPH